MLFLLWFIPGGAFFLRMVRLFLKNFHKNGITLHVVYRYLFSPCSVVNLPWLESFSVCLSGIGFGAFILLTLVHGVIFETIFTSTLDIISPQEFFFLSTHFKKLFSQLHCHCLCLFFIVRLLVFLK